MRKFISNNNLRARLVALTLVLVLALSLMTGCHGARKTVKFEVPTEFDTSRDYEITFWAKNDSNATQVEIYEKAIEDFHALYPNITVVLKKYSDYNTIYQDVITNIATGTTPNVCITYPDHIATYITGQNVVVPLDDLISDANYGLGGSKLVEGFDGVTKDQIVKKFLDECTINDTFYALPFMRSTEACYINKTYVEKLGYTLPEVLTWDFVWEVSEAAMAKDKDGNFTLNGKKTMIPFIYKSTDNMMISMLAQQNAPYSNDNGDILIFNDTTRSIMRDVAEHSATRAFSTFKISSYPGNYLNAGECIFAIDSTAGATWMGPKAPHMDINSSNVEDFEIVVMAIPQYDTTNPKMISQGPSVCVFNKDDPQEVLASWLFAQYLLTNDVQIAYSETEGYVPVTTKAQESAEYLEYLASAGDDADHYFVKIEAAKILLDNTDYSFVTPVFNGSTDLRNAAGALIEDVVKNVRRGKYNGDASIEEYFADVQSLYHLTNIK